MEPSSFSSGWLALGIIALAFVFGLWWLSPSHTSSKRRKLIEGASLFVATLGIFGLLGQNRMYMANLELNHLVLSAPGEYLFFETVLSSTWECLPSERSEYSPSDFDEIVSAKKSLCDWQTQSLREVRKTDFKGFPELPVSVSEGYPVLARRHFKQDFQELMSGIERYHTKRRLFVEVKKRTRQSILEIFLTLYSPFFLATAVGLTAANIVREPSDAH